VAEEIAVEQHVGHVARDVAAHAGTLEKLVRKGAQRLDRIAGGLVFSHRSERRAESSGGDLESAILLLASTKVP
jgi:hypothetical protein